MDTNTWFNVIKLLSIIAAFAVWWWASKPPELRSRRRPFVVSGINMRERSVEWLIEDVDEAEEEVFVVTSSGRDEYWGHKDIMSCLQSAHSRGVHITFILGKDFQKASNDSALSEGRSAIWGLAKEGIIELRLLPNNPCAGLRLVDDVSTYTTSVLPDGARRKRHDKRPYLHTWHDDEVTARQRKFIKEYLEKSQTVEGGNTLLTESPV